MISYEQTTAAADLSSSWVGAPHYMVFRFISCLSVEHVDWNFLPTGLDLIAQYVSEHFECR